ncbi:uncharacterized protein LOC110020127 [Phalaenopsis equestris]|uniref:uncharacterized protein LOC110020127 n=1 Tax=Phalaenopsis equestris TaxID=78828 RepID=UPI0009E3942A|nr:uncharacterized protein LOC110020127 [Phalaenopsis equestris]
MESGKLGTKPPEERERDREARRKRLSERKTDRLAFITGHSRTLAQSEPQDAASEQDIIATETPKQFHSEDSVSNTLENSSKQEPDLKPDPGRFHKFGVEKENPPVEANYVSREQKNEVVSNEHNRTTRGETISGHGGPGATNEAQNVIFTILTPRNISHSVIATENIRLLFSFVMAILVILSYNGFMIGVRLVSSIISFRPLFLVLLNDVAIILGWVFMNQGINQKPENDTSKIVLEDGGWPNQLSKILEVGQVLHKILGAAFMDVSICAIFMICEYQGNAGSVQVGRQQFKPIEVTRLT